MEPALDLTESDLQSRQKQERKELLAQTQKLKHGVPKGDRKKKKEVTEQIAKLEAELEAKHENELKEFKAVQENEPTKEEPSLNGKESEFNENDETVEDQDDNPTESVGRKSKAQRRRDKKMSKEKEREERIKEQEVQNKLGPRFQELLTINSILKERSLALHEIPADGNCLYSAVSHQLSMRNEQHSTQELRKTAADYMRDHPDDFLPFLTSNTTGDMMTANEYEKYCDKTAKSPVWGGQLEIRALSEALQKTIEVLQANSAPLVIGKEESDTQPLTIVYHRHVFRLGEHYNSVTPRQNDSGEEDKDAEDSDRT